MFNWVKTFMLMAAITALFIVIGGMIGGRNGMTFALLIALGMNFFSYWFSDKMVLRMYNAQEVDASTAPQFYNMVHELAARRPADAARVPDQRGRAQRVRHGPQSRARRGGRHHGHPAGALRPRTARRDGPRARAREASRHPDLDHRRDDGRRHLGAGQLAMFFGGRDENGNRSNPIAAIAVAILAPLAASLIQMAISRAREFEADRGGAEISGDPQALASALDKIHRYAQGIPFQAAEEHPATAQMMIMNPLGGGIANLFSTHPATEERIARLMQMAQTGTYPA
jgi:heat shock protein HtpX